MPAPTELLDGRGGQSPLDDDLAGARLPRKEAAGEVGRLPGRRVDRRLEVHAVLDVAQDEDDRPLALTLAARRADRHPRLAAAKGEGGRRGRARALAGVPAPAGPPPPPETQPP